MSLSLSIFFCFYYDSGVEEYFLESTTKKNLPEISFNGTEARCVGFPYILSGQTMMGSPYGVFWPVMPDFNP